MKKWKRWHTTGKIIGKGGQGRVYLVVDKQGEFSGDFALKELNNRTAKAKKRFKSEVEAILKLKEHENIIKIVDKTAFESKDPFYVMELADSNLMEQVMERSIDLNLKINYFFQMCEGVKMIHQNHIIHRDLKPQNVLIKDGIAKISDFGVCLIAENNTRLTNIREVVGPRLYMAPELEDGGKIEVDHRADIYSLGKILYFMLSDGKIFSREKYKNYEYDLSNLFKDNRYKIFNVFFEKTINESKSARYSEIQEMIDEFKEICSEFLSHPKATLKNKLQKIDETVVHNFDLLGRLNEAEFEEFLKIVKEKNLSINEEFLNFSIRKSDGEISDALLKVIELNLYKLRNSLKKILIDKFIRGEINFYSPELNGTLEKHIRKKAIESNDSEVINGVFKKIPLLHLIDFEEAKLLVGKISLLTEENQGILILGLSTSIDRNIRDLISKLEIKDDSIKFALKILQEVQENR
ncbi:protein kinase [Bacillus cereus]|nr:protein kinase [Bacillus cereus]MEB9970825.1 protein kinase [Bacillus cereus]